MNVARCAELVRYNASLQSGYPPMSRALMEDAKGGSCQRERRIHDAPMLAKSGGRPFGYRHPGRDARQKPSKGNTAAEMCPALQFDAAARATLAERREGCLAVKME